ncbi:AraC family transcriptional regulator N-terminal domain-containing protein [Planktotalea sp.]|uniref:AraC family transcriptional regulator n=1 Tax=Planktotalea sp. TaxID=2029877 RepID=UPI003D6AB00A
MIQDQIKHLIQSQIHEDGMIETGINGVQLFRATSAIPCAPAIYEPSIIVIASGAKEATLDGRRYVYDNQQYMCCPMSMPVNAGTPTASKNDPLYGVYISLSPRVMNEMSIEIETSSGLPRPQNSALNTQGIKLAQWDAAFSDALLRLLQLCGKTTEVAVLGDARLREVFYAVLTGEAGQFARQSFNPGNAIARSIAYVSSNLKTPISIDDLANRAGMSRAVFHRKFKHATTMSPIQFVKTMRLNTAAMRIAEGMTVSEAAMDVGYISTSQFSREFKRSYGQSPKQWTAAQHAFAGAA